MDLYDLHDHVNLIKATYSASMAEGLARYKNGDPVFFYTWAPNWTIYKFEPGKDVVWINVPELKPTEAQKGKEEFMVVEDIKGGVTDTVKLGFVVSDIRPVANKKFIQNNPAIKKFFEVFELPLKAINEQNTLMQEGEKSSRDIERHASEWIKENQQQWNQWLEEARKAAN